jgi:hypothetical protein
MVLTLAQTTALFTDQDQMGIPAATYAAMAGEGIVSVDDLADFDKDSVKQMADNLRRGQPNHVFGARSQKRLLVLCDLVRFYQTINRDLTAANIRWNHVAKNFEEQWKALKDRKDADEPEVPKISKTLPVMKWTESFPDFLRQVIGVRTIPLIYVIRSVDTPPAAAPVIAPNQPHSMEHGSVEQELIALAKHTHPLYRDDNSQVYFYLEEATRSTVYSASIKPFQRSRDGRGAWLALIGQYAGVDKWEAEIKKQEQLIHTSKWKGQSNFSLEAFASQHRNAFVSMTQCAQHVQYQLPNGHSRVGFFLDAIECSDAGLQAAMASVRTDQGPNGMRSDFERAVAHVLPYDPVAKKRAAAKRGSALISSVDNENMEWTAEVSGLGGKPSIGKTGVHLRYHKHKEFSKLSREQRDELTAWRESLPDSDPRRSKAKKAKTEKAKPLSKRQVASVFNKELKKLMKEEGKADKEEKKGITVETVAAMVKDAVSKEISAATASSANELSVKSSLKSILKRAKNGQM